MRPARPQHDLALVARLAQARRVIATRRVVAWLTNHDYDAGETLVAVLAGLQDGGRWVGSTRLMNGEAADEYVVRHAEDDWYVKFWIDGDQLVVNVWSCCWDGAVH